MAGETTRIISVLLGLIVWLEGKGMCVTESAGGQIRNMGFWRKLGLQISRKLVALELFFHPFLS